MLPKNFFRNPFEHHVIFGFVILLFVVFSSAFANAETLTWTKIGGSGSWHDDTNWNPERVPTDEDDVIIPVGTAPVSYSSGTTNLNSLSCSGSLTISNGILNLSSASSIGTGGILNLSGGSLGGSGDVTVSGNFTWTSGTLTGGGAFTTSGTSTIGGWITLDGRTLTNSGAATWEDALQVLYLQNGAHIENSSSGSITIEGTASVASTVGISGSFTNAGTLTLSGAVGTVVQFNIPFSNSGSVDIGESALGLGRDGIHTGSFTVPSDATLQLFYGSIHSFEAGMVLSGAGQLQVSGGATLSVADPLNFTGSVAVSNGDLSLAAASTISGSLTLSGGSLGGSGDVTVSGNFTWTSGTLTGGGAITTSGTSTIGGWITLDGRTLTNSGAATWEDALQVLYLQNGAHIENSSSGSITIEGTASVASTVGISGSFTNAGTLTLSGAVGTVVQFNIPFSNSGSVDIGESALGLGRDGIHTGSFTVPSDATLQLFYGSIHSFEAGMVLSGAGQLQVSGGATLSVADPLNFTGSVTVSNGDLSLAAASTISGSLTLSGGSLGGSGDVTVSGNFTWTSGTLTGGGAITTSGTSTIGGWITLDGRTLTNSGAATWEDALQVLYLQNGAHIENSSSGSITIEGTVSVASTVGISGSFTNAGTLTLSGEAGTVQFSVPFSNSGSVDIGESTLRLTTDITNTGTITGSGTLDVTGIEFINAGNINPGTSSGILTINGNFQQSSIGALNTEIAGTDGSDYDQLNISGNLNLFGILNLSLIEDFLPVASNSFTIVTFSSLNGLFTQINWPALNPGLAWEYRALATNIQLYCGIDTDLDGLPDTLENTTCTDTNDADTDADALLDGQEDLNKNGQREPWETDPCNEDTDNDTMPDGWEVGHGLDPLDSSDCGQDPDDDLLTNCEEYLYDTDPNNADTDADGMPDGWEVDNNFDPLVDDALEDADQDGYSNLREYLSGSDPWDDQDLPPLIADVDADNDCDGYNLAMFMLEYGRDNCDTISCDYDLDLDGDVDEIDLHLFSEDFGSITTP